MEQPEWYGLRYPSLDDLEAFTEELGAGVIWTRAQQACFRPGGGSTAPAIFIPRDAGGLEKIWLLAHELAHLVLHSGPKGTRFRTKNEAQANRWAACALIPYARIMAYQNACSDAMIAALSAHYEDLPLRNCPSRTLAGEIARYRIQALEAA